MDLMMSPDSRKKKVSFVGSNASRTALRAIKRKIEQWIAREQTLLFLPKDAQYSVEIKSGDGEEKFDCAIRVRIGSRQWAGQNIGRTVHEAVEHSLAHLRFVHALV